jgi:hypothetical protein
MKYAIAEEDLGFFLGAFQKYGIFAKNDVIGLSKAIAFDTEDEANLYIDDFLGRDRGDWKVIPVETNEEYVSVVYLVKNGYGKYTHKMIDFIPMTSTTMH